jgi:hypothetical protein
VLLSLGKKVVLKPHSYRSDLDTALFPLHFALARSSTASKGACARAFKPLSPQHAGAVNVPLWCYITSLPPSRCLRLSSYPLTPSFLLSTVTTSPRLTPQYFNSIACNTACNSTRFNETPSSRSRRAAGFRRAHGRRIPQQGLRASCEHREIHVSNVLRNLSISH